MNALLLDLFHPEILDAAEAEQCISACLKRCRLRLELSRKPNIIAIQESDEIASRFGDPGIACRGRPQCRLTQHTDRRAKPRRKLFAAIGPRRL